MSRFSTLDHPETSDVEGGGQCEAVTVHVSAEEALAHAKPTRTHKEQLNKEALRVLTHNALLHQRRLPPHPEDSSMSNNINLLM